MSATAAGAGAEAPERLIALEGAVNFRDLGGYTVGQGLRTRWRALFRADGLGELTEDDLDTTRALGIRTVLDLRSGGELEQSRYDVDAHPVSFHHFPFIQTIPDPEEFDRRPDLLQSQYIEMLDTSGEQIVAALRVLASPDALPAVFHCTAGKDRTGLLSAIVLSLVGVPEETVVADYALSAAAMDRLREKIIRKYPDSEERLNTIDGVFTAEPRKMEVLLDYVAPALRLDGVVRGEAGGGADAGARAPRRRCSNPRTTSPICPDAATVAVCPAPPVCLRPVNYGMRTWRSPGRSGALQASSTSASGTGRASTTTVPRSISSTRDGSSAR